MPPAVSQEKGVWSLYQAAHAVRGRGREVCWNRGGDEAGDGSSGEQDEGRGKGSGVRAGAGKRGEGRGRVAG